MNNNEMLPTEAIVDLALKSPTFRDELLAAPKVVIERSFGTALSDTAEIKIIEEDDDVVYLVLPRNIALAPTEEDRASEVIVRALQDDSYRARLLAEPKATLEEAFDMRFPEDVEVKVLEDSDTTMHLILPAMFQTGVTSNEIRWAGWGDPEPTTAADTSTCTDACVYTCTATSTNTLTTTCDPPKTL